jgi:GTPase
MTHKAGFVNIIGNPNVGKSSIMNVMVGEKLSIVTSKAQTTRHRIMGIVNNDDYQIVYSDTPGVLVPNYKLQEKMMEFVGSALVDADVILYVTDVIETIDKNSSFLQKIQSTTVPILLLINKTDLTTEPNLEEMVDTWHDLLPFAEIYPVSALHNFNLDNVLKRIIELLPENPPFYPKDELTDKTERFFASEIIREKILLNYKQEIPYSVEIVIDSFKETEPIIKISATINVMRETQKGIIIGKGGLSLKKTGTESRFEMEKFFGKKVFLELFVKVSKNWREDDRKLRSFGYNASED